MCLAGPPATRPDPADRRCPTFRPRIGPWGRGVRGEFDSWWSQWPDRLASELAAFERHSATTSVAHDANGLRILHVQWPVPGRGDMFLRVGFSAMHPFFRPDISAPEEAFGRHQNPLGHSLCLVAQGFDQWDSGEMVADMIARQLTQLLSALEAREKGDLEAAARHEEVIADPVSIYYHGLAERLSAAYLSSDVAIPSEAVGLADAIVSERQMQTEDGQASVEIVLHRLLRPQGPWLADMFDVPQRAGKWVPLPTRWARVSVAGCHNADDLIARAEASAPGVSSAKGVADLQNVARAPLALTIVIVEDEADYSGAAKRNGFIFILSRRKWKKVSHRVVRSFEISEDLFDRLPIRGALREKRALLIGCGAIGSFVGMELARAGFGQVDLLDHDVLEPANYVRWPFGRPLWGVEKAIALAGMIAQHFPLTQASALVEKLGLAESKADLLKGLKRNLFKDSLAAIVKADVVIDATANVECQQAMAYHCKRLGKPLVIGNATLGAAGGIVAQFRADAPACYNCARQQWKAEKLPDPAEDPGGRLVPMGCNQETFTGGSYDLQEVSLQTVRSAIGLAIPREFHAGDWDLAVLSHQIDGARVLPSWQTAMIRAVLPCCTAGTAAAA